MLNRPTTLGKINKALIESTASLDSIEIWTLIKRFYNGKWINRIHDSLINFTLLAIK